MLLSSTKQSIRPLSSTTPLYKDPRDKDKKEKSEGQKKTKPTQATKLPPGDSGTKKDPMGKVGDSVAKKGKK